MYCIAKLRLAKDTWSIQTKTGTRMQIDFGDLALVFESDCVTNGEVEYIEKLVGDHAEMQVS